MSLAFVLMLAVTTACLASQPPPPKPLWPRNFDAAFGLTTSNGANQSSHFYYDWDIQATLIAYPVMCLPGLATTPCNLLFLPTSSPPRSAASSSLALAASRRTF